jgi:hypothetical protein
VASPDFDRYNIMSDGDGAKLLGRGQVRKKTDTINLGQDSDTAALALMRAYRELIKCFQQFREKPGWRNWQTRWT